ncbi:MAG: hypothetical protein DMF61_22340 [Blastocatellia bacterium AA13]|nr:MAG: hypothetical protein DMF61_22340 [Blastocatellia bacterium AA13]
MLERQVSFYDHETESRPVRMSPGFGPLSTASANGDDAAVWAKQLEIKVAAANLGQAEYYLDRLKERVEYLQSRAQTESGISRRELEELTWARSALSANVATMNALSEQLERGRRDLERLVAGNISGNHSF